MAAPFPPPAIAPIAAPAPAAIPTFAAFLPLFAAASLLIGDRDELDLRAISRASELVSSIERLAFPLTRPPLSASATRPSTLAPAAAMTQSPDVIGSSRTAENGVSGLHRLGRELAGGSDRDHLAGLEAWRPWALAVEVVRAGGSWPRAWRGGLSGVEPARGTRLLRGVALRVADGSPGDGRLRRREPRPQAETPAWSTRPRPMARGRNRRE